MREKDKIEEKIYLSQLNIFTMNTDVIITSSYFEGIEPKNLAKKGYSCNKRGDLPQILLGLVRRGDGDIIVHKVFEENRSHKTTISEILNRLKKKFNITKCVFKMIEE